MWVASLSEPAKREEPDRVMHCLACGKRLDNPLSLAGSLRCQDCRTVQAPLDPELVALWQKRGSSF